jgi:pyruvate/2-oxoglutarate dehydrogenase complex dihydrolipoamide acyltransferase (E2) component
MKPVILLKFGQTMEEGTVVRWLKQEGEWVSEGDSLVEVETDKSTMEICSEVSGMLKRIVVQAGNTVPVLTVLAYLGEADEGDLSEGSPKPG